MRTLTFSAKQAATDWPTSPAGQQPASGIAFSQLENRVFSFEPILLCPSSEADLGNTTALRVYLAHLMSHSWSMW